MPDLSQLKGRCKRQKIYGEQKIRGQVLKNKKVIFQDLTP
jgi:hypothetical protein